MRIIKQICSSISVNDRIYPVKVIYKTGKKNISYRFKDNMFIVTTPIMVKYKTIQDGLTKFAPRLLSFKQKPALIGDDYIYILGDKYDLNNHFITLENGKIFRFDSKEELLKELKKYFLVIITNLVHYYQKEMGISQTFNIHIKEMKTRYGSYSRRTQNLSFGFELVHYNIEMSKAVVVHELSHYYVFDHSDKFYSLVYKYYPNYNYVHTKLRKGEVN